MSGYVGSKRSSSLVSATEITLDGAKLKSSGNSITKSDGTTAVLSESGGVVTLNSDQAVIEGSSSGDLVRITQTGSGNALVVEDSTNPDSTPFVVDASGNVGIGSSNPATKLVVEHSGAGVAIIDTNSTKTTPSLSSSNYAAASINWFFFVGQSGDGSSITTNNIFILGNGDIRNTNNSYGSLSDIKLKENIADATPKLNDLLKVNIVNYNLKTQPDKKHIGVIAQELEQIFPSMVEEVPDIDTEGNYLETKTKSVKYSIFVPILIKALQEQQALIESQQSQIDALNLTIASLISRIEALESQP